MERIVEPGIKVMAAPKNLQLLWPGSENIPSKQFAKNIRK
jgi:hypothetical protein